MLVTIPVLKTWISLLTMSNWPRSTIACAWRASRKMPFRNRYKKKIKLFRYL